MSHKVVNQNTGHSFEVEDGESILDAALRQGVVLAYSCKNGTCGSCHGRVVDGDIAYPDGRPLALTEAQMQDNEALFCQARACSDLTLAIPEIEAVADIPVVQFPARVLEKEHLAHDVIRLRLRLPKGKRFQFLSGQYLDVVQEDGKKRSFSIASAACNDHEVELHVRHVAGGGFTGYVFDELNVKDILRFEGPKGTFFMRHDSDKPILMMGGGTGFAPLKAIIEQMIHDGLDRPIHLFWGARGRSDLYQHELAEQWAAEHDLIQYTAVLSAPEPGDEWQGATGFVHEVLIEHYPELSGYDIYMSGPPAMIDAGREHFAAHGLDLDRLFYDSFDYAPDVSMKIAQKVAARG
jgi:CDP-4-dehydro-6-deoxyglucose reductase